MSTAWLPEQLRTADGVDFDELGRYLLHVVVGDRTGAVLFLASLVFFSTYWRAGIFSTDTYAIANSVVAAADGHLYVDHVVYGPDSGVTPGMHVVDGRLYGRNYGQVLTALPVLWLLQGLSLFADVRLVLVGGWSLTVGALVGLLVARVARRPTAMLAGSFAALVLYVGQLLVGTQLSSRLLPLVALQIATMVAAALIAVFLYRLVARMYGRRVGAFAGAATFLATPVGFWASIPKRHTLTALLVVLALYTFYRSRSASTTRRATRFRALAYVWVGFSAWIHAGEGLVLLLALAAVDLVTARSNRPRDLALVGAAFAVSLVPFFLTNLLVAGNPIEPPRLLPTYRGGGGVGLADAPSAPDAPGPSNPGGSSSEIGSAASAEPSGGGAATGGHTWSVWEVLAGLVGGLAAAVESGIDRVELLVSYLAKSVETVATDGEGLFATFVRSGYVSGLRTGFDYAINLSVLESMPLLGAVVAAPLVAVRGLTRDRLREALNRDVSPLWAADLLAVAYVLLHVFLYLSRFPLHHMLTVRYLHPLYPLGVYGLVRLGVVRRTVDREWSLLVRSYVAGVGVGFPVYLGALVAIDAVLSEAVQLYAVVAFVLALAVAAWAVVATAGENEYARFGAVVLGVAGAATTVYLLASGLTLFAYTDQYVLPFGRILAESLRPVNPFPSFVV